MLAGVSTSIHRLTAGRPPPPWISTSRRSRVHSSPHEVVADVHALDEERFDATMDRDADHAVLERGWRSSGGSASLNRFRSNSRSHRMTTGGQASPPAPSRDQREVELLAQEGGRGRFWCWSPC